MVLRPSQYVLCARAERRLNAAKQQVAVLRTLIDELERCIVCDRDRTAIREQLVQELARLA